MKIITNSNKQALGQAAAHNGAELIRAAIAERGKAAIVVATGASQFEILEALVEQPDIDWNCVSGFHLDEYIGIPITHPASFRRYLKERFVDKVSPGEFYYIDGQGLGGDVDAECHRLSELIGAITVDVAFVGIGENGHLAFNDPPADFETERPYWVVELDEDCRRQQLGEGWFDTLEQVPCRAISMSIRQIMKSQHIICCVPDERKATAVYNSVEGPVSNLVPASILQQHPRATIYLDPDSAGKLTKK